MLSIDWQREPVHETGASIRTRTRCVGAARNDGLWHVSLQDLITGNKFTLRAKALVNAAGPWVNEMIANVGEVHSQRNLRLVKGSHLRKV